MISIFLASLALWLCWIVFAKSYPHLKHDHPPLIEAMIHFWSIFFLVFDVIFNITYGSIVFLDLPREGTLTLRLKRYLAGSGWRYSLALFFCKKLIEPWDWNHCGLANDK